MPFIISCTSPTLMTRRMLTKEGGIKYYYHHEKCYFVERSIATYSHCISVHNTKKMCVIKRVSLIYAAKSMNYMMVYYCNCSNTITLTLNKKNNTWIYINNINNSIFVL